MKRRKFWSHSLGDYKESRVRVYERPGGMIYGDVGGKRASLGHRDRDRAIAWAKAQRAELVAGHSTFADPTPSVARVFALYLARRTPKKGHSAQEQDRRCAELWTRLLGAKKDLRKLMRAEWERFLDLRQSGAITPRGESVPEVDARVSVRARTVAEDGAWLKWVLNWAMTWQVEEDQYLLESNPARGFALPEARNPRRPVATHDRFEAIRSVSDRVTMEVRADGKRYQVPSYLSALLDVVNGTGRRISAILSLRYEDLRLNDGKHGAIRWPADTDKMDQEFTTPVSAIVRAALDRVLAARPGLGRAYLFPSPRNAAKPVSKDLASAWLEKAERLAGVPKHDGSLWHAYRRKWATERKHLPDRDVAQAGGWKDVTTLKTAYQQVDAATLQRVVSEPAELREVRA